MEEKVIDKRQGNGYDKILKENIDSVLPSIMKNVLSLDIAESIEIPDSIQYTKERTPDLLRKVTDRNNNTFVLHVEWQSQNDKDMVYRMAEYAVMFYRKYRIPILQYVIFIGNDGIKMITEINQENLQFKYKLIDFKNYDYKIFLNAEDPAIKVLAILGNFENDDEEQVIENICHEVKAADAAGLTGEKHYNQLRILANLRNININSKFKDMISVSSFFKVERDVCYQMGEERGMKQGMEKANRQTAIRMKNFGCDVDLIALALNLSTEEVQNLQTESENINTNN